MAATASHVCDPVTAISNEENQGTPEKSREYPDDNQEKRNEGEKKEVFFFFVERYEGSEFSVKKRRIKVTGKCIKRRPKMHGRTWKIYKWKKDREERLAC